MNIVESMLPMKLDLYIQIDAQDTDTGEIRKEWIFHKTLACSAKGMISNSTSARTGDSQKMSNDYKNKQMVQIRTSEKINLRHKITNIRSREGIPVWTELNYPSETPTVFELVGTTPITDPFGSVIAFNSIIKRSENQTIGF